MTINAPQAAARIREALERSRPFVEVYVHNQVHGSRAAEIVELIDRAMASNPEDWLEADESPRALLAERDELAKAAATLREALKQIAEVVPGGWHKDDGTHVANSFIHQARAALTPKD